MTTNTLKSAGAAICALVFLHVASAQASTDKLRAEAYFNAIAGGNADTIASFYADKAEFHWVGGPLAGVYNGKAEIKAVWTRFIAAVGEIDYKVLDVSESQNGKIATVTARVDFIGPTQLPVKFVLMYENGKIVKEIWEVDKPTTFVATDPAPAQPPAEAPAQAPAEAPAAIAATVTVIEQAPPLPERVTAVPAEQVDDPEGAPPVSLNTAAVDPVAPPPARKAATPAPKKPKAKVARKAEKKTYRQYDEDYDDEDDYAYEPGYRYGYGYRSPLRFRYGYGYYHD